MVSVDDDLLAIINNVFQRVRYSAIALNKLGKFVHRLPAYTMRGSKLSGRDTISPACKASRSAEVSERRTGGGAPAAGSACAEAASVSASKHPQSEPAAAWRMGGKTNADCPGRPVPRLKEQP